jgi:hypothetical protein
MLALPHRYQPVLHFVLQVTGPSQPVCVNVRKSLCAMRCKSALEARLVSKSSSQAMIFAVLDKSSVLEPSRHMLRVSTFY